MATPRRHEETPEERHQRRMEEAEARLAKCPIKETNLLSISRGTDKCRSCVEIEWDWETRVTWLRFGEATLRTNDRRDGKWNLEARMGHGATDPEHDSAFVLRLPLIGVEFEWADWHMFRFHGYVDPSLDPNDKHNGFHVPRPGYDPTKHPKAEKCSGKYDGKKNYCKWGDGEEHIIVPEGFYVPPLDAELYKLVAGKRVTLIMGKAPDDEED